MPLHIIKGNITRLSEVDVIVNAANDRLAPGAGVAGAIESAVIGHDRGHRDRIAQYRGEQEMITAQGRRPLQTGEARITHAPGLPYRAVIHTVGPIYSPKRPATGEGSNQGLLRQAYWSALDIFEGTGYSSIAFPLLSSGIYGYPMPEAGVIAISSIEGWLRGWNRTHDHPGTPNVYLVAFDEDMRAQLEMLRPSKALNEAMQKSLNEAMQKSLGHFER